MSTEEIVYHTLFLVCIISSLSIIFYYRRTVHILISASFFLISFLCTFSAMYIISVPVELLERSAGYRIKEFSIMLVYIYGLPVIFLLLLLAIRFFRIRIHPIALLWLTNSGMYSFWYLLLWFIADT